MRPTQRNEVARNIHYCVNCQARTHVVAECSSSDTYLYCQQLHHTLLHPKRRNRTVRRSVNERLGERPGTTGSPVRNGVSVVTSHPVHHFRPHQKRQQQQKAPLHQLEKRQPNIHHPHKAPRHPPPQSRQLPHQK
ncbi:hypothetical protein FF38_04228 [Lucilia cuprina]|uniref:Uncharacterized protein n=1 Tax=Lucilia cuprina TaxID=7375 RepID=A0A0L0C1D3_LUCCU|nr:hypothetical protein FF38_04228 [Lucilia cuprina]